MTTLFQDLVADVITETARPDLGFTVDGGSGEIPLAVQAATLKMHGMDFYFRDAISAQVVFDEAAYIQTLDTSVLPRYRNIWYFRKWDPTLQESQLDPSSLLPLLDGTQPWSVAERLGFIFPLSPTDILDGYGAEKADVMYQAGTQINIKSATSLERGLISYFAWPYIGNANASNYNPNYDSWIARGHKFAIIYDAAATVMQKKGQQDQARKMEVLINEQKEMIRTSNTVFGGF
jgi:hypothetical protein